MAERPANPTDAALCRLLAAGPVPTAEVAARLAIPERTARHRLYRLRQAGVLVTDADGRHRLADPLPGLAAPLAAGGVPDGGPLPQADAAPRGGTPVVPEPTAGAEPVATADAPVRGLAGTVLVAVLVVLAAAGAIGVWALRRWAAPAPAAPPPFRGLGNPWGGGPWPW